MIKKATEKQPQETKDEALKKKHEKNQPTKPKKTPPSMLDRNGNPETPCNLFNKETSRTGDKRK